MLSFIKIKKGYVSAILAGALFAGLFSSCNKALEVPAAPVTPVTGTTVGEKINTDPNYSILKLALTRTGLLSAVSAPGNFTIFAPDDNAFIASGLSSAVVNALPVATLTSVVQYHVIPQQFPSGTISSTFPNMQMPTLLQLPGGNPLLRMNVFPAKNGTTYFANNLPIVQPDAFIGNNGVMHRIPFILQPPATVLAQQIYTDPNHTYLTAAIARADSGQVGLNRLDSVLKFGVANVTVFAPTNAAFQTLLTNAIANYLIGQGVLPATALAQATALASTPAVFSNPALYPVLTPTLVRGIVAFHILGSRAFSPNLPLTTSTIRSLIGPPPFPQITVDRSLAAPRLIGPGNGGQFANFTALDRNAVNGVWHVIDRVLLPQ